MLREKEDQVESYSGRVKTRPYKKKQRFVVRSLTRMPLTRRGRVKTRPYKIDQKFVMVAAQMSLREGTLRHYVPPPLGKGGKKRPASL